MLRWKVDRQGTPGAKARTAPAMSPAVTSHCTGARWWSPAGVRLVAAFKVLDVTCQQQQWH